MGNKIVARPKRRGNNPDDAIGSEIVMNDACLKSDTTLNIGKDTERVNYLLPLNGEYIYVKRGNACNACLECGELVVMQDRSGCDDKGNCATLGYKPIYTRNAYYGDINKCCLERVKEYPEPGGKYNITCKPEYRGGPTSPECQNTYRTYCGGPNMWGDYRCKLWTEQNPTEADKLLTTLCTGSKMETGICKAWCDRNKELCATKFKEYCGTPDALGKSAYCRNKSLEDGFEIDVAVEGYCRSNSWDPYCVCMNAVRDNTENPVADDPVMANILSRPECYMTKCSSGIAYQTLAMKRNAKSCPSINVCQNTINALQNYNTDLTNVTQSCNQGGGGGGDEVVESSSSVVPIILVLVLLVIIIGIIILKIMSGSGAITGGSILRRPGGLISPRLV